MNDIPLQNGDIVLRNTKGLLSSVFRNSSLQQPKFTHAGFLHKKNKEWFVYHFIDDDKKPGLHIEKLQHFIDRKACNGYAFFRYDLNKKEQVKLDKLITAVPQQPISFDQDFNLSTDSKMYCTEWIAKTLDKSTDKKDFIPSTTVAAFNYIAPDNLYLNKHCKPLYSNAY